MKTKSKASVLQKKATVIVDKALDKIKKVEFISQKDAALIASNIDLGV